MVEIGDIRIRLAQLLSDERNIIFSLMLFGLICWLYNLNSPLLDHHSWRQTDTAAIARNFYNNGFNLLYPQIDWGGAGPGYVESEFQLIPFIISILYLIFGVHEFIARLVVIAFSVGSVYLLYRLIRLHFDRKSAAFGALFFIISPIELFFGRAVMPESSNGDLLDITCFFNVTGDETKHLLLWFGFVDSDGQLVQENVFLTSDLGPGTVVRNNYVALMHDSEKLRRSAVKVAIQEVSPQS